MAPADLDDELAAALADAGSSPSAAPAAPAAPGNTESDAMAAEWEAMLGGGDGGDDAGMGGRESTRVLNQDEIDSLLGFDEAGDTGSDRAGIQAILNSALVSYE